MRRFAGFMMHVPTSKRPQYGANDSIESVPYRTIPQVAQISCCYGKFILNIRLLTFALSLLTCLPSIAAPHCNTVSSRFLSKQFERLVGAWLALLT